MQRPSQQSGTGTGSGRRSYNRASNSFKFHNFVFNQDNQSFCLEEQHGNKKITVLHWKKSDAANGGKSIGNDFAVNQNKFGPTSVEQVPTRKSFNKSKSTLSPSDDLIVTPAFPTAAALSTNPSSFEPNVSKSFTNVTKLRTPPTSGLSPVVSTSASFPLLYSHAISPSSSSSSKSPFNALLLPRQSSSSSTVSSSRQPPTSSTPSTEHLFLSSAAQFPLTHNFNKSQICLKEMISKSNNSSSSSATNFSMSSSGTSNPHSQSQLPLNLSLDNLVLNEASSHHRRSFNRRRKPSHVQRILLKKSTNNANDDEEDFIDVDGGSNSDISDDDEDDDDEFDENEDDNMSSDRDSLHSYKTYRDHQMKHYENYIQNDTDKTDVQNQPLDLSVRRDHNNNSNPTQHISSDNVDIVSHPIDNSQQHKCDFESGDPEDKEDDIESVSVDESVDSFNSFSKQHDQFLSPYCFNQIHPSWLTEPSLPARSERSSPTVDPHLQPCQTEPPTSESSTMTGKRRSSSSSSSYLSASTSNLLNPFLLPLPLNSPHPHHYQSAASFLAPEPDIGSAEFPHHRQHHERTHSYMFDTFLEEEIYKILQSNSMSTEKFDDKSIRKSIDEKIEDKLRSLREEILSGKDLTSTDSQHSGLESSQDHFKLFKLNSGFSGSPSAGSASKNSELWNGASIIGGSRLMNSQANSLLSSKSRLSQRSQIKRQLEDAFKQNGFLVKTKQVSDANNSAMFCKFRQLRKYTRYYLKSWQNHLPDEVNKLWKGFLPPINRTDHPSLYHLSPPPPPSLLSPTSPTSSHSSTSTSKTTEIFRTSQATSGNANIASSQSPPYPFGHL